MDIWIVGWSLLWGIFLMGVCVVISYFSTKELRKKKIDSFCSYNATLDEFVVKANTYAKKENISNFSLSLVYSGLVCSNMMQHDKSFADYLLLLEKNGFYFAKNIQTDEFCLFSNKFGYVDDFQKEQLKD